MNKVKSLNDIQIEAIKFNSAPQLIIGAPGTGKTTVLTHKIAYLLKESKVKPTDILVLAFTNQAAIKINENIQKITNTKVEIPWVGTFYSVFAKILRKEAKFINLDTNFSIYDKEDSVSLVNNILLSMGIEDDNHLANKVQYRISYLKNHMISPSEYKKNVKKSSEDELMASVYEQYIPQIQSNNSIDIDDIILKSLELFETYPKILAKYNKYFKYIFVDEYQDINIAKNKLLNLLHSPRTKICVAADDNQSIFSWKGGSPTFISIFKKKYPKYKIFTLEQNYRNPEIIFQAAEDIIKNNTKAIVKKTSFGNSKAEKVGIFRCSDEKDEAVQVLKLIKKEITSKKLSFNDIALLYRIHYQSRAIEDIIRRDKIPYNIFGGVEFYRRKEIKDILAYLRVIINYKDEESLLRIMNFPQRGIGTTSITKMVAFARELGITLYETMGRIFEVIEVKERIQKNIKHFKILLNKYVELKDKLSLSEFTSALVDELGILRAYKNENTEESIEQFNNIQKFLSSLKEYTKNNPDISYEQYLENISLYEGIDEYNPKENCINMMTVHNAKGLEFPVVFITGCEEDIFPLNNKFDPDADMEEERRLFYVALTRAKTKVIVTYSRSRYRFGEVAYQNKSRFIEEIDEEHRFNINGPTGKKAGRKRKGYYEEIEQEDFDFFGHERKSIRVGSRVLHDKFGIGKVISIDGTGETQRANINFEEYGIKQLLIKYAKLKYI
ncbi:MAG: UvrD-helicase domain-containing protein [Ignavibacteriales bacterium]|nr:UvrD-helicase domain-containing protein [Ignavibacteriales bacterium]